MAHRIINNKSLNSEVCKLIVSAPEISKKIKPGQFIILRVCEKAERIPLTVYKSNPIEGSIELIIQKSGVSTTRLCALKEDESILDIVGPLGMPSEIKNYGKVICIAGGVGIAEIYPLAAALKKSGNTLSAIIGARSKEMLILEDEIEQVSPDLHITTDDGSYKQKGNVADVLKDMLGKQSYDIVFAVGPVRMMQSIAAVSKQYNLKTIVSHNSIMVDGTGMCGSCRVSIGDEIKFVCVDGPDFDAHLVDFDELLMRQGRFAKQEKLGLNAIKGHRPCH